MELSVCKFGASQHFLRTRSDSPQPASTTVTTPRESDIAARVIGCEKLDTPVGAIKDRRLAPLLSEGVVRNNSLSQERSGLSPDLESRARTRLGSRRRADREPVFRRFAVITSECACKGITRRFSASVWWKQDPGQGLMKYSSSTIGSSSFQCR